MSDTAAQTIQGRVERTFRSHLADGRCAVNVIVRQHQATPCRVHALLPCAHDGADRLRELLPPGSAITLRGDYLSPLLDTLDMALRAPRLVEPAPTHP